MHYLSPVLLATLPGLAQAAAARYRGAELNIRDHDHAEPRDASLEKRASCGGSAGSCPTGQCCSASGKCGTGSDYCTGPQCQIAYSGSSCDASKKPAGETTINVPRNTNGNVPYNVYITTCKTPGTLALTFDDGPYKYTDHVLDLLEAHNVKATFFIVGNNLGKGQIDDESTGYPKILRRMHSLGHQLASHTWTHQDLSNTTDEIRTQQIVYNEMAFRNIFGWFPKYLRPPYATCSRVSGCLDYVTKLGYHVVNFNIDTKDYVHNTPGTIQISKDIFSDGVAADASKNSYIELSHDIQQQTAYNLTEFMLTTLKERGYKAVTVGECLGDPPENWYVDASCTKSGSSSGPMVSKDGTCGSRSGGMFTCQGSKYGNCCSYNGFCGSVSGYCDGGCQSGFGSCNTWNPSSGLIVSDNGLCGDKYHQTCKGSRYGNCCSKYGNCGKTDAYCGTGCQGGFGTCS